MEFFFVFFILWGGKKTCWHEQVNCVQFHSLSAIRNKNNVIVQNLSHSPDMGLPFILRTELVVTVEAQKVSSLTQEAHTHVHVWIKSLSLTPLQRGNRNRLIPPMTSTCRQERTYIEQHSAADRINCFIRTTEQAKDTTGLLVHTYTTFSCYFCYDKVIRESLSTLHWVSYNAISRS